MSMLKIEKKTYNDGRTKQCFKDSCDINKLLVKAARTGALSHFEQFGGQYGDFSDFDFMEAQNRLAEAKTIFEALPGEVRREFDHDPSKFFEFANHPDNVGRLAEVLPQVAEPGAYVPAVRRNAVNQAVAPEVENVVTQTAVEPESAAEGE